MPRKSKNYTTNCFYEIICKDPAIKDNYIGSTTDFFGRKSVHKHDSKREKTRHLKLYTVIHENGGWENWNMIKIEDFPCTTDVESKTREQYWISEKKPTLNKNKSIVLKEGESIELSDSLSAEDRNRAHAKWRNDSLRKEMEELRAENIKLKEENALLRNQNSIYLNKS